MIAWQYHIETINTEYEIDEQQNIRTPAREGEYILEDLLRSMGQDGWELAGFLPAQPEKHFQLGTPKNPWVFYAVFKRPRGEAS